MRLFLLLIESTGTRNCSWKRFYVARFFFRNPPCHSENPPISAAFVHTCTSPLWSCFKPCVPRSYKKLFLGSVVHVVTTI